MLVAGIALLLWQACDASQLKYSHSAVFPPPLPHHSPQNVKYSRSGGIIHSLPRLSPEEFLSVMGLPLGHSSSNISPKENPFSVFVNPTKSPGLFSNFSPYGHQSGGSNHLLVTNDDHHSESDEHETHQNHGNQNRGNQNRGHNQRHGNEEVRGYDTRGPSRPPINTHLQDSCQCQPMIACAACFEEFPMHPCSLNYDAPGVCCPPKPYSKGKSQRLFPEPNPYVTIEQEITRYNLDQAAKHGLWQIHERDILEESLIERRITVVNITSPAYRHLQFFKTTPVARAISRTAVTIQEATLFLKNRFTLSPLQAGYGLRKFEVRDTVLGDSCPGSPNCGKKENFYRTADGSCNNQANPNWGRARRTFRRLLAPSYEDGVQAPRGAGRNLPSARVVSTNNVEDVDRPDSELSLSVMQWGQFIDHDLTHAPIFRLTNSSGLQCCTEMGGFRDPAELHPECLPISIPKNDPFFGRHNQRCMNFIRSMRSPNDGCNFGLSEQINQITHFLDGSNIYGSESEETASLREGRGGLLRVQGLALLPADREASEDSCDSRQQGRHCFLAGDGRVNEQPSLATMHTVWMREHNRLALMMAKLNPQWSDETLFQEARRIVVASMQHIVYNEWLPIILGKDFMNDNHLSPLSSGFSSDYDPGLNPDVSNEFATVGFRFGHTLVQGMLKLFGKNHKKTDTLKLHEHFSSPHLLYTPGKLDEFLRGLIKQPMQKWDNFVSSELTNRLFQGREQPFGMDLIALNTQRGRDHGIPAYNDLREACGLPRARDFSDLLDHIPKPIVERFARTYASVDDIDPFIGGISEDSAGGLLGPTFRCIVGEQFIRTKRGDRFFYDNGDQSSSFTPAQLAQIRSTSWARILCDNGHHIKHVTPLSMRTESKRNPKVSCDSPAVPRLNLGPWKSNKSYK